MKKKLRLKNIYQPVKERKNFSWKPNNGSGRSLIDYIAKHEKYCKTISRCKVVHKVDTFSDHYLVVAKVKIKLAKPKRYNKTEKTDRERLKDENNKRICQKTTITETNGKKFQIE